MSCQNVGDSNPDIGGIGIQVTFVGLMIFSALLLLVDLYYGRTKRLNKTGNEPKGRHDENCKCRACTITALLIKISDIQSMNGVALLVSAFSQSSNLDLYHLRLVYETASLSCISGGVALSAAYRHALPKLGKRGLILTYLWLFLMGFTIYLCDRLWQWDVNAPGQCYNTSLTSGPGSEHPRVDVIYVAVTCAFSSFAVTAPWTMILKGQLLKQPDLRLSNWVAKITRGIETASLMQQHFDVVRSESYNNFEWFWLTLVGVVLPPVHIFMIFALRASNVGYLGGEGSENSWGFGQVIALFSLASALVEGLNGFRDHRKWKRERAQTLEAGPSPTTSKTCSDASTQTQ